MAGVRKELVGSPFEAGIPAETTSRMDRSVTPMGAGKAPLEIISHPPAPSAGPRCWELLLVESHEQQALGLIKGLSDQGYNLRHLRDGRSTLLALRETPWPTAILIANDLPDLSGFEICRSLRGFGYGGHLLLMVEADQSGLLIAALDSGADDVISKLTGADELSALLRAKNRRCLVCNPNQSTKPGHGSDTELVQPTVVTRADGGANPLTPREQDVLEQMVLGLGNHEIAEVLFLSLETVKTHVRNVMGKLKARHRTQAVIMALQSGYCLLPPGVPGSSTRPNRVGC